MMENVLAGRYASPEMREIWDSVSRVRQERHFWVTVLEVQRQLGLEVGPEVLDDYRKVIDHVDLDSIAERERRSRHDVKARLEEFNALAGHEAVHLGMTSRDLTENVEQLLVRQALALVLARAVSGLERLAALATEHSGLAVTARTHNVPAQLTTMGKRFASAGEELLAAVERLEGLFDNLRLRGIKGPVGTQQDQVELLGSADAAAALDEEVARRLGFGFATNSVAQIYPRSWDLDVVAALVQLASGPANLTNTLRLMAGHDLATEGFQPGQVGSSAMPHKMNARTSERIHGFKVILTGHLTMASGLAGEQWNEGDVSCSVVRRVMLPDAFFAADGLFQAFLTVLDELGFFPAVIEQELEVNLPFLSTTRLLVAAVKRGMGRERAHEIIKRHATDAAHSRRQGEKGEFLERLAADASFPLDQSAIRDAVADPLSFTGRADAQVQTFVDQVKEVIDRHPEATGYRPAPIL